MRSRPRANPWFVVCFFLFCAVVLLVPGIYALVQRTTGTPARASIDDCETTGGGRYERTDCSGTWIVGGDVMEGGHVIVGTVDGAEQSDTGKTIDVMLHGDRAYSRSLETPIVLLAFGIAPLIAAFVIAVWILRRKRVARKNGA